MQGREAAAMFYQPGRFTRRGALPPTALRLLQDKGSALLLEGAEHRHRKAMLVSLLSPPRIQELARLLAENWRLKLPDWERQGRVVLQLEVREVLTRAVCAWAGVPLSDSEVASRAREFGAMIEGAGAFGPRNWKGMALRTRSERWARALIKKLRAGELEAPDDSAAHVIAWHRDLDGELLDVKTAAVELLNILRPTVAVDRYITFAALALHEHPDCVGRVRLGTDSYLTMFVNEVRRFYPFFPAVGGRLLEPVDWRGHHFEQGTWVLLDLYGTNHDRRLWEQPHSFEPERFRNRREDPFELIPQGGGEPARTHRCAGEELTIELIKRALRLLTTAMSYRVPDQDLRIDPARMPAIPRSRFVIDRVRDKPVLSG